MDHRLLVVVQVEPIPAFNQLIQMGLAGIVDLTPVTAIGVIVLGVFLVRPRDLDH